MVLERERRHLAWSCKNVFHLIIHYHNLLVENPSVYINSEYQFMLMVSRNEMALIWSAEFNPGCKFTIKLSYARATWSLHRPTHVAYTWLVYSWWYYTETISILNSAPRITKFPSLLCFNFLHSINSVFYGENACNGMLIWIINNINEQHIFPNYFLTHVGFYKSLYLVQHFTFLKTKGLPWHLSSPCMSLFHF